MNFNKNVEKKIEATICSFPSDEMKTIFRLKFGEFLPIDLSFCYTSHRTSIDDSEYFHLFMIFIL